jgi:hypothetical protein
LEECPPRVREAVTYGRKRSDLPPNGILPHLILEAAPNTKLHVGRVLKQAKGDPDA